MKEENRKVEETRVESITAKKKIQFFSSFEDAENHKRKEMLNHSYETRLQILEILRKRSFGKKLLSNGKWPDLIKTLKVIYND